MPLLTPCFELPEFAWGAIIRTFSDRILSIFTLEKTPKNPIFSRAFGAILPCINDQLLFFSRAFGATKMLGFGAVLPLEMIQMCVENCVFFWPPKAAGARNHSGVPLLAPCFGVPLLAPAFQKSQIFGVPLLRGGHY